MPRLVKDGEDEEQRRPRGRPKKNPRGEEPPVQDLEHYQQHYNQRVPINDQQEQLPSVTGDNSRNSNPIAPANINHRFENPQYFNQAAVAGSALSPSILSTQLVGNNNTNGMVNSPATATRLPSTTTISGGAVAMNLINNPRNIPHRSSQHPQALCNVSGNNSSMLSSIAALPSHTYDNEEVEPTPIGPEATVMTTTTPGINAGENSVKTAAIAESMQKNTSESCAEGMSSIGASNTEAFDNIPYDSLLPTPLPPTPDRMKIKVLPESKTERKPSSLPLLQSNPPKQSTACNSSNSDNETEPTNDDEILHSSGMHRKHEQNQQSEQQNSRGKVVNRRRSKSKSKNMNFDEKSGFECDSADMSGKDSQHHSSKQSDTSGSGEDDEHFEAEEDTISGVEGDHNTDVSRKENVSNKIKGGVVRSRRGRPPKASNSRKNLKDDDTDDFNGFVSIESHLRRVPRRSIPNAEFFITNDDEPDRLTNPLLAMVPENFRKNQNDLNKRIQRKFNEHREKQSVHGGLMATAATSVTRGNIGRRSIGKRRKENCIGNNDTDSDEEKKEITYPPVPKVTGTIPVEEFMNSASIVFNRPDTYPLSFLARLLGFDIDVPNCNDMLVNGEQESSKLADDEPSHLSESQLNASVLSTLSRFPTPMPDPKTLPIRKDTVFLNIPPEGTYFRYQQHQKPKNRNDGKLGAKPMLGDWDDERVLDYMDPIYKSFLQNGWESQRCSDSRNQNLTTKFIAKQNQQQPIRKKVVEMAQQLLGLSTAWTFQDWGSFQSRLQQEGRGKSKTPVSEVDKCMAVHSVAINNDPDGTTLNSLISLAPPSTSLQQEEHRRPRNHNNVGSRKYDGPKWKIDGKEVFGQLPKRIFGILASFNGEPVALLKYEFLWYKFPIASGDGNKNESKTEEYKLILLIDGIAYRSTDNGANRDGRENPAARKGDEGTSDVERNSSVTALDHMCLRPMPIVSATAKEIAEEVGQQESHSGNKVTDNKQMTENDQSEVASLPQRNDTSADFNENKQNDPAVNYTEARSNKVVKAIMLALALEHARSCEIFHGVWETPQSLVEMNESYFRMVKIKRNDGNGTVKEDAIHSDKSNTPRSDGKRKEEILELDTSKHSSLQPMICDLKKCSSRLVILKLLEEKHGEVIRQYDFKSNIFSTAPERLLVEMPSLEEAHTLLQCFSTNNVPRHSKRGAEETSLPSNIFTGVVGAARNIEMKFRAELHAGKKDELDFYKLDASTGSFINCLAQSKSMKKKDIESKAAMEISQKSDLGLVSWRVLRCFPIVENALEKSEPQNEMLDELMKKQKELIAIEEGLEQQARGVLATVIRERMEYESPEAQQQQKDKKKALAAFQEYLSKRKEIDQVLQERQEEDMDAVCSICNDGDVTPDNQILFCEACNVAVHQMCYGVEKIPDGDYYCIACRHYGHDKMIQSTCDTSRLRARARLPPLPVVCELCPLKKGAFTRVDTSKSEPKSIDTKMDTHDVCKVVPKSNDAKWIHMTCAKWHGLDFVNKGDASLVEDVTQLKTYYRRLNRPCSICKGIRGAYVKCRHDGCDEICHITCAIESGICEVIHGEDVEGNPILSNPWSILCPKHSKIEKKPENLKCVEELVSAAKEFPLEPMPPPLIQNLRPYNKLTGEERKMALSVREYEDKYMTEILRKKLSGVRCEVCDVVEDIHGRNLCRCDVCGSVVCHTCELFTDTPGQSRFRCYGCRSRLENENDTEPQCSLCNQKGGLLVKTTSAPMVHQNKWDRNPREFEKSLFTKARWVHILCAYWHDKVGPIDENTKTVDLSHVIAANGKHFVSNGQRCGLCGLRSGLKARCSSGCCHAYGKKNQLYHFHATCARQAGFEVVRDDNDNFVVRCYVHGNNECNLRARLEDLIEMERKRAGKDFSRANAPMAFSEGSKQLHGAIMVMRILGWAWRWAEWWVQHGSTWEPLLEPGQVEAEMTAEELRIIESTKDSRMNDARKCRLAAFGAALRNRNYDKENGFNTEALERALRALLHTQSLVGPLQEYEVDFFVDILARAYRSKSRLLGFGKDKIPVANDSFCLHLDDQSPKFELGDRPLPGNTVLSHGQIFEESVSEPDDFLKHKNQEKCKEVDVSLFAEIDYKYKGALGKAVRLVADIDTDLFDKDNSYLLRQCQHRGHLPNVVSISIVVKVKGKEITGSTKISQRRPSQLATNQRSKSREEQQANKGKLKVPKSAARKQNKDADIEWPKNDFGPLSSASEEFLRHIGIKSLDEFMKETRTKFMYEEYNTWRELKEMPPLKDKGAGKVICKWKSDVRKYYSRLTEIDNDDLEEEDSFALKEEEKTSGNKSEGSVQTTSSNSATKTRKRTSCNAEVELKRPSKRNRSDSEPGNDSIESEKVDEHSKKLKLSGVRESVPGVKESEKVVEMRSSPRVSNVYRKGFFKEVDDTLNETDPENEETDPENEIIEPRKRRPGRPRNAQKAATIDDTQSNHSNNITKPIISKKRGRKRGRPPKSDKTNELPTTPRKDKRSKNARSLNFQSEDTNILRALANEPYEFLSSIGVTSTKDLLTTQTNTLATLYAKYRKKTGRSELKSAAPSISTWKKTVRDAAEAAGDTELADTKADFCNEKKLGDVNSTDDDDICEICLDGGDLVICDGCEKSYHPKCVNLDKIPEGDWFCPKCKEEKSDICAICGNYGDLLICDGCENSYHTKCVGLSEVPEGEWFCPECKKQSTK